MRMITDVFNVIWLSHFISAIRFHNQFCWFKFFMLFGYCTRRSANRLILNSWVRQAVWTYMSFHLNIYTKRSSNGRKGLVTKTWAILLWYTFIRTTQTQSRKRILMKEKSISGRGGCVVLMKPPRSLNLYSCICGMEPIPAQSFALSVSLRGFMAHCFNSNDVIIGRDT